MQDYARLGKDKITNPLTKYLRSERGMTLKGWATINGFSYGMTSHVVNGGRYDAIIVKALREQELYEKLPQGIRRLIEKDERVREARYDEPRRKES